MKLFPIKYNWSCIVLQVTTRCCEGNPNCLSNYTSFLVLSLHKFLSKGDLVLLRSGWQFLFTLKSLFDSFSPSVSTCFLNILTLNMCVFLQAGKHICKHNRYQSRLYKKHSSNYSGCIPTIPLKAQVTSPSQWISISVQ